MSSKKISSTLLEHLPTEIFLQIFAFLPLQELATSFAHLNFHIDSIIRSVRGKSHGVRYNDINAINLLQSFPTLIDRLVIINAERVDLTSLINLRSLSLEYGTSIQLNTIRPHNFPRLEILHIKGNEHYPIVIEKLRRISSLFCIYVALHTTSNGDRKTINDLFQVIFSDGFPRLRICTALDIGALSFNNTWTGSSNLQILNLKMNTDQDYENLRSKLPSMRQLTIYQYSSIDPKIGCGTRRVKRLYMEHEKLQELESENKFIIDAFLEASPVDTNKPPPRFNNTRITHRPRQQNASIIRGRILPQTEPYCRASFLIEIAIGTEYPFKCPEITFLDPIYHPNIAHSGICCGCSCGFGFSAVEVYKPSTSLSDIIRTIIEIIDSPFTSEESHNPTRLAEYRNDYPTFCKKALECTLSYGRPRY